MIIEKNGNIVANVKNGIILHQVNAQGVMGSGVAWAIRQRWASVWEDYSNVVKPMQPHRGTHYMGRLIMTPVEPDVFVASLVGQQFYGRDPHERYTSYDALDSAMGELAHMVKSMEMIELKKIPIHFPLIGCGLGGGKWPIVAGIIEVHFPDNEKTLWTL